MSTSLRVNARCARALASCLGAVLIAAPAWAQVEPWDQPDSKAPAQTPTTNQETPAETATPPSAPDSAEATTAPLTATIPVQQLSAQDEPVAKEKNVNPQFSRQIEEIVVTATKREENLRDIPASISAFKGEDLEKQGKVNLEDFIQETPGVVANSQGPGSGIRVTIRGIATESGPTSARPSPVGIFIGDTSFTDPYIAGLSPDLSAFDLAGVQVLKGPQGTLFGGAALAGAIRYVLKDPVLDEWQLQGFSQYVNVTEGSSAFTNGAVLNAPLVGQDLALRLGYVKRRYPGVIDDTRAGTKDVNDGGGDQKRAILLWKPVEDLSLKLTHLDQDFSGRDQKIAVENPKGPRDNSLALIPEPASNSFSLDSFEAAYDFESVRAVSLTSYIDKKRFILSDITTILAGRPPNVTPPEAAIVSFTNTNSHALSQELRLQSTGTGSFKWLVGGYFFDYTLDAELSIGRLTDTLLPDIALLPIDQLLGLLGDGTANLGNQASLLYAINNAKSTEKALFFDLTQTLWDKLELSGGARYYQTTVAGGYVATGALARSANNGMDVDQRNRIKETGISPRASISYRFTEDLMLYTAASRGFRFGGLQNVPASPTAPIDQTYKSDSLWNYEIGTRTSWFDRSLNIDVTGFYIDYKNPQVTLSTAGTNLKYISNIGAARSYGVETSLLWLPPIPGMVISLAGGLTDARTTVPFMLSANTTVPAGTQLPGAAKSQYSASVKQILPLGIVFIDATVSYTYVGKGFSGLENVQAVNDYGVLSAGLGLGNDSIPLKPRLSLNVANILNETAAVAGASDVKALDQVNTYSIFALNPPRTFSLRLNLSF